MRWIAIVIAGLALSACQANKPLDELSYSELKTVADQIGARCEAQGITRKSPEWGLCVQQETNRERAARDNAPRLEFNPDGAAAAMNSASAGYYRAASTYNSVAGASVTCTTAPAPTGMVSYRCR